MDSDSLHALLPSINRSLQDSTIDTLLRSLTDRPNVESTLILSRKDGSIIKSAGFASAATRKRALSSAPERPIDQTNPAEDDAGEEQTKVTPAEELAASVFQFMTAAGALGSTLATVSAQQDREGGMQQSENKTSAAHTGNDDTVDEVFDQADAQIQLLRLRIKQQEMIVFPDPRYICCVVQRVGKLHNVNGR